MFDQAHLAVPMSLCIVLGYKGCMFPENCWTYVGAIPQNGSSSSRGSDSASSSSSSGLHVHAEHVSGDLVGYQVEGGVAFLSIQNPPVNSLSQQVMRQICSQHRRAIEDPAVRAIVVCGSRGKFIAGADIAMMHKMQQKGVCARRFVVCALRMTVGPRKTQCCSLLDGDWKMLPSQMPISQSS